MGSTPWKNPDDSASDPESGEHSLRQRLVWPTLQARAAPDSSAAAGDAGREGALRARRRATALPLLGIKPSQGSVSRLVRADAPQSGAEGILLPWVSSSSHRGLIPRASLGRTCLASSRPCRVSAHRVNREPGLEAGGAGSGQKPRHRRVVPT